MLGDIGGGGLDVSGREGGHARGALDRIGQLLGRGRAPRLIGIAGGEDLGDDDLVGIGEGGRELVEEERRAGVHVRLEDRPQPPLPHLLPRCSECGTHLGRMVPVVVVDDHPGSIGDQLHPAPGPGEGAQRLRQRIRCGAQLPCQAERGGGVEQVVGAGQR